MVYRPENEIDVKDMLLLVDQIGDELRFQNRTVKRSEDEPDKRVAGWPNAARVPSRVESKGELEEILEMLQELGKSGEFEFTSRYGDLT